MPMIQFVPDTLILSGEVNDNFQNAVSVDTPRNVTVSHEWSARQNFESGIALGDGSGAQPALTFLADPDLGFYRKSTNVMGVAGRLDLPNYGVVAGNGIQVSGGSTTPFTVRARRSTDGGNALVFGSDGGLFVSPGQVAISTDEANTIAFGSDGGLFVKPPIHDFREPSSNYTLAPEDAGRLIRVRGASQVTITLTAAYVDPLPVGAACILANGSTADCSLTRSGPTVTMRLIYDGMLADGEGPIILSAGAFVWIWKMGERLVYILGTGSIRELT